MTPEIKKLEQQVEELNLKLAAAKRNQLRREPVHDYTFVTSDGKRITLSQLFGDKPDLLIIHNMGRKCPYCTLWADGFNGVAKHLANRAGFVVFSPDPPEVQREVASSRGWTFPMVSPAGNTFSRDMGYEHTPGDHGPGASGFRRHADGTITRTGTAGFGPGDDYCAVWHLFELLENGADGWAPKYTY